MSGHTEFLDFNEISGSTSGHCRICWEGHPELRWVPHHRVALYLPSGLLHQLARKSAHSLLDGEAARVLEPWGAGHPLQHAAHCAHSDLHGVLKKVPQTDVAGMVFG
mmetsp:Transcript_20662/g.39614  ORF Transcript_20662/g.39614 Transcript_20662/m.39614 type:complete len:107 (+) Transcript_20662:250-570(+)